MLRYLLTFSAPPYTLAALRWNRGSVKEHIQEYHTVEPLHRILAKAPSFGLYLDHIPCIFEKSDPCYAKKMHFFENATKFLIAGTSLYTPTEFSKGRMDPRVGSGHNLAGFWRVESGQHFENILVPAVLSPSVDPYLMRGLTNTVYYYYYLGFFSFLLIISW